jgi:hypothetical protein
VGTAVLPARRASLSAWTLAPTALAAVAGLAYLVLEPRPGDLAVHEFRAELFGREGFTIWNGQWYGGHHTPAYSAITPALSWLVGPRLLLVVACVAVAALFEVLARAHFGPEAARFGAAWLGVGTATLLATSRLPFAVGTAFGLGRRSPPSASGAAPPTSSARGTRWCAFAGRRTGSPPAGASSGPVGGLA